MNRGLKSKARLKPPKLGPVFFRWQLFCSLTLACFSCATNIGVHKSPANQTSCDNLKTALNSATLSAVSEAQIAAMGQCPSTSDLYAITSDDNYSKLRKLYPEITVDKANQLLVTLDTYSDKDCEYHDTGGRGRDGVVPTYTDAAKFAYAGVPAQLAEACLCLGIDSDTYRRWNSDGFHCTYDDERLAIGNWLNYAKITSPEVAAAWLALDIGPSDALQLQRMGLTPAIVKGWQAKGIDLKQWQFKLGNIWAFVRKGYDPNQAIAYLKLGLNDPGQIEPYEHKQKLIRTTCHGTVASPFEIFSNPYNTTGKCYEVLAHVVQWFGPTHALMNMDFSNSPSFLMMVDFPKSPNRRILQILAIGEGAYSYTSVGGVSMTVPRIHVLAITAMGMF